MRAGERRRPWQTRSAARSSYAGGGLRLDCTSIRAVTVGRWLPSDRTGARLTSGRGGLVHERGGLDIQRISQFADRSPAGHTAGFQANDGCSGHVCRSGQIGLSQHLSDPQPLELGRRVESLGTRHTRGSVLDVSRNCPASGRQRAAMSRL